MDFDHSHNHSEPHQFQIQKQKQLKPKTTQLSIQEINYYLNQAYRRVIDQFKTFQNSRLENNQKAVYFSLEKLFGLIENARLQIELARKSVAPTQEGTLAKSFEILKQDLVSFRKSMRDSEIRLDKENKAHFMNGMVILYNLLDFQEKPPVIKPSKSVSEPSEDDDEPDINPETILSIVETYNNALHKAEEDIKDLKKDPKDDPCYPDPKSSWEDYR